MIKNPIVLLSRVVPGENSKKRDLKCLIARQKIRVHSITASKGYHRPMSAAFYKMLIR